MAKISGKLVKKIAAIALSAATVVSCLAFNASAADTRYSFQTNERTGTGENWWLDTKRKFYDNIQVTCSTSKAHATMQLWKEWIFGDVWCSQDQTITVGKGHRVWWYGDREHNAQYHITANASDNNGKYIAFTGNFYTK